MICAVMQCVDILWMDVMSNELYEKYVKLYREQTEWKHEI
jgi:uncharacterized membrane protein